MKNTETEALKVVFFQRSPMQGPGFYAGDWGRGIFIPGEDIVFIKGRRNVYGFPRYYVSYDPKILQEIKDAINSKNKRFEIPIENACYSNIQETVIKDMEMTELVVNIQLDRQLRKKIRLGIEKFIGPRK